MQLHLAQVRPGRPGARGDSAAERLALFRTCLEKVEALYRRGELGPCRRGLAFPWRIGCGLGGGDWPAYLSRQGCCFATRAELEAFAARMAPVPVCLVRRPGS